jgi:hypothetical protein
MFIEAALRNLQVHSGIQRVQMRLRDCRNLAIQVQEKTFRSTSLVSVWDKWHWIPKDINLGRDTGGRIGFL